MKGNKETTLGTLGLLRSDAESVKFLDRLIGEQPLGLEQTLLQRILERFGCPPIRIALWDGTEVHPPNANPRVTFTLHDRATLWRLVLNPELHFGDDYSVGRITVEGDLVELLEAVFRAKPPYREPGPLRKGLQRLWLTLHSNTIDRAKHNIHHHYDLGNDFYRLWLDEEMAYTCAYFPDPEISLEEAQFAKHDHVCRKLRLQPGETVVEAGCGWGGLARHMARYYGAKVRSFNISHEQVSYARERAEREGLADRVEYIEEDYRNIDGGFDAFVSIGMLEHVGVDNYAELGGVIDRALKPDGRGLIHSIGKNVPEPTSAWTDKRIFPGGYSPTLGEIMQVLQPYNFSVTDVENLRLHYAQTLRHWLQRYERHTDTVERMFDPAFVRAWRLYLSASIAGFSSGNLQLFQVLFQRPNNNAVPWSRGHLYPERRKEDVDGQL